MRIILYILLFFNITNCQSQKYNLNSEKNIMTKFNIENFRGLSLDEKYSQSPNDVFYKNKQESVRITTGKTNIQVERSDDVESQYKSIEIYSIKDSLLIKEGEYFSYFPIGIWREYENGELIKSVNYDEGFNFSIENLIKKMKKEFEIDIMNKRRTLCYRYLNKETNKSFYEVCHRITDESEQLDCFLFDGNSGVLLYRVEQFQQDKNGSLYEQYKSIIK